MHNFSGSLILVREYPSFIVFHKVTLPHRHSLIGTSLAAFVHLDYSFFAVEIQPDQNGCERSPVGIVCHIKRACFNCITYRPSSFSPSGHFFFAFNSSFALSARLWYLFFQYSIESCLCRPSSNVCLCLLILQLPNAVVHLCHLVHKYTRQEANYDSLGQTRAYSHTFLEGSTLYTAL